MLKKKKKTTMISSSGPWTKGTLPTDYKTC